MPELLTLRDLHRRLSEATGADRELDAALMDVFYARDQRFIGVYDAGTSEPVVSDVWVDRDTGKFAAMGSLDLTSSIDAIRREVRRAFQNACFAINEWGDRAYFCFSLSRHEMDLETSNGVAPTTPLAACLALVSGLIAVEELTSSTA